MQAIGGKEAFEKLNTRTAKGAFELPSMGASGTVELYAKAPNKVFTLVSIPGFGEIKQGFDGTTAWAQDPDTGKINDLSGTQLSETKISADFRFDLKLKELYPQMSLKGREESGGRESFVIEATAPGVSKKMYFDAQTGLLSRIDSVRESADGKRAIEEYYSDYKELDGVKFAHTYRQKNPQYDFYFKFDDVKHNQTIDDARFVKPTAQSELKEALMQAFPAWIPELACEASEVVLQADDVVFAKVCAALNFNEDQTISFPVLNPVCST
ncbi:MAG: hypothetical protein WKF84_26845 [Pyrinomonadaceae bacterium]